MNDYSALTAPDDVVDSVGQKAGRTIEEILAKEPELDTHALLGAVEVLVGSKICRGLETTFAERMVFAFAWLAREVQNGSFDQYFFNSAGDFWQEVLKGLSAIGDQHGLELFERVLSIFPNSTPSEDRSTRQAQLAKLEEDDDEKVSEHFDRVTTEYYHMPFPNWELVLTYVKAHRSEFALLNP